MPYQIEYSPGAVDHLRALSVRDQRMVVDGVDEQLAHEPLVEPDPLVTVLAVGLNERNIVRIGGETVDL